MNEHHKNNTDKIIRLVEYHTALARINAKIVRTLDDYRKVLWIHDIPHEPKYCFTQAWGQEEEQDTSVWIEIKKFPETELPKIPPKCTDWVKWETLSGHEARRHVIIAKASLEFETHLGKLTIKQAVDGDLVDIELDMLDVQDQPQNVRQVVETGRESIGANKQNNLN
jgi:hypothetical protein